MSLLLLLNAGAVPPSGDPGLLHAEMLQRIEALEDAVKQFSTPHGAIGHNNPPEPIDGIISPDDRTDVLDALDVLKSQPPQPEKQPAVAISAVERLQSVAEKVRKYIAEKGDVFVTEFAKSAGASAGKQMIPGGLIVYFHENLVQFIQAAIKWLQALPPG